jgi:hypothetical protein
MDSMGRLIMTTQSDDPILSWPVSQLNPGLYILSASNEEYYGVVKLLIR